MKLQGKTLTLVNITRQSIFDATYVCACDNCGKTIINIATVIDTDNNKYQIGLDCKKALIDKPIINGLLSSNNYMDNYKAKEYKSNLAQIEKFLKCCAYDNIDIAISNQYLTISVYLVGIFYLLVRS